MRLIELCQNNKMPIFEDEEDDRYEGLDDADSWLKKYTLENLDKWPNKDIQATLAQRYPVDQPTIIYRGLNFATKELWEKFQNAIKSGTMETGSISSWAPNPEEAESFALTKPTYFLDKELMQAETEKSKNKEMLSGYRGVILKTTVDKGQGIDVRKSKHGHESEIILLPGTYQVAIHEVVKRFKDQLEDGDTDINREILSMGNEDLYGEKKKTKFFHYIMHHHINELSDEARHHLFTLMQPPKLFAYDKVPVNSFRNDPTERQKFHFHYPSTYYQYAMSGLFTSKDTGVALKQAKQTVSAFVKLLDKHSDYDLVANKLSAVAKWCGMESQYARAMQKKVKGEYDTLQQKGREINNIKDPEARKKAIDQHAQRLQKMFAQI